MLLSRRFAFAVVGLHAAIILATVVLYYLRIYSPHPAYDVVGPFLIASGPLVYVAAGMTSYPLEDYALSAYSREVASGVIIIIVPATVHVLLGSAQWYFVVRTIQKWILRRRDRTRSGSQVVEE